MRTVPTRGPGAILGLMRALAPITLCLALGIGCGDDGGGSDPAGVFDPSVTSVSLEIDYEPGAEPYTGSVVVFGDLWRLTTNNLDRIFASKKALSVPDTLAEMQAIGAVDDEELTIDDLLGLADRHRDTTSGGATRAYYVLFVTGNYADGDGPHPEVLAVSIGTTGVIAMFKDVIAGTGGVGPNVERFVEQSTLVHEMGHALGLVANGVATTTAHHDSAHGAHCTNDRCVMYYLNEGASDMAAFARDYVVSGDTILFDSACLGDVDALTGGP